jgi:hypothetical protein
MAGCALPHPGGEERAAAAQFQFTRPFSEQITTPRWRVRDTMPCVIKPGGWVEDDSNCFGFDHNWVCSLSPLCTPGTEEDNGCEYVL